MWVPFNPNYDGLIVESEEKEDETVVPGQPGEHENDRGLQDSGGSVSGD